MDFHGCCNLLRNCMNGMMLEGIISQLPDNDSRLNTLRSVTVLHRQCGLVDVASDHYSSSHWLGTFVVYLVTARGLDRYKNPTWTGLNN
ncbi:DUF2891 family protein [Nostoc sp. PCC 9305]|uniref:DUF2891 family protein n=1 Tax=Nostoc sp. PCC 9305 TaxID=296636 RepID=UPI0039C6A313